MPFISTRGRAPAISLDEAVLSGLAPDGGLYAPASWPTLPETAFAPGLAYAERAALVTDAFAETPEARARWRAGVQAGRAAFPHPAAAPLVQIGDDVWLLELFHGPTRAFKDFAMQLAAAMFDDILEARGEHLLLVTATSGDTGAAAVRAFAGKQRVKLAVLHPEGRVSPVQRLQMTTTDAPNVLNLAVTGDFDDCQALVKRLLGDEHVRASVRLSSVNSINFARLLGQVPYYIAAGAALGGCDGRPIHFVTPTGNMGDVFAGWIARRLGAPIGALTAAVNRNDVLHRALSEGVYRRSHTTPTHSVAMDIQAPSNFERLVFEMSGRDGDLTRDLFETFAASGQVALPQNVLEPLRGSLQTASVDEAACLEAMRRVRAETGVAICPHTAVGVAAAEGAGGSPKVILATAHPAKFPDSVLEATGAPPPVPADIAALDGLPERVVRAAADYETVRDVVLGGFA